MNEVLLGAIGMASLVAGLLFARFWRTTRDRFFLFFAASFGVEGVNRFLMGARRETTEAEPIYYLIRLVAFVLILVAIIDKNRTGARHSTDRVSPER
jgi:uncharacterized membrane protein HdeD (DUF308 family)